MRLLAMTLAATSALVALPRPASACSLATNDIWSENANHSTDATAPSVPTVFAATVERHFDDNDNNGCGGSIASCGSFGTLEIDVTATDDRAAELDIGYEVTIVGGNPPAAFDPARDGRVRPFDGQLIFFFDVDSPDFSVDLEIRAVDGNGNVGDPIVITVVDERPNSGGCAAGHHGGVAGFGLIAFATAIAMRRRRR